MSFQQPGEFLGTVTMISMEVKHATHLPALCADGIGLPVRLGAGGWESMEKIERELEMPIKPFASERGVCRSRNIANVAARIKRGWLIWCENWARKLEKRGRRQTERDSLGSRARGSVATWEESPDQRPWNDVSRIQIVKQNSPRAGGFSLSISSSVCGSRASCVSLVFFLKPRTLARFDATGKAPETPGCWCCVPARPVACLVALQFDFRPFFPPRHY